MFEDRIVLQRWGRQAAGLLVVSEDSGILLQHRAEWSHFGGTWGLPGGARHRDESARDGAVREAAEEAGVPPESVQPLFLSRLDLGWWSYSTVVAATSSPFVPVIGDAESIEVRWVPLDDVEIEEAPEEHKKTYVGASLHLADETKLAADAAAVPGSPLDESDSDLPPDEDEE